MSYRSLPFTSKFFQLTSLTCALALAGCGGDSVDVITPAPGGNSGGGGNTGGGNNGGTGGNQNPVVKPDFFLQALTVDPSNIELSDQPSVFKVTVKAVETASSSAMSGQSVSLKVSATGNVGAVTIEGASTLVTDSKGEATYELKLNPQAVTNETQLLANGFTITASSKKSNGTIINQVRKVPVSKKGSGDGTQVTVSKLNIKSDIKTSSVSNGVLNPFGDSAKFKVEIKDEKGALAPDVIVGLGIAPLKGVTISPASQTTDNKGIAIFDIKIDENISKADRDRLLTQGIPYSVNLKEKNGATKSENGRLEVAIPTSDYLLNIVSSAEQLSAYGDSQQLTIVAAPKNSNVPTSINGAKATVKLNSPVSGVSIIDENVVLDAQGKANVVLNIAPTLTAAERQQLATQGISYTVALSEPNSSVTTKTFTKTVYIPTAQYKINFNGSSKKELSSSGGSAVVKFRVNDSRGGVIAGQKVTVSLPRGLADAGLLTLESSADQTTDTKGEVGYTVRVPNNLTLAQKTQLENAKTFALTASIKEASGVPSEIKSENIRIGSDIGQSDITLTAKSIPTVVSILEDEFKLQVVGKRKNGSAAIGRTVKLVINEGSNTGITIRGNEQATNNNGVAEFSIGISQNLTKQQRDVLIASGISYTAILTDEDGTQSKIVQTVKVEQPMTTIQFASIASPMISEFGGSGNINIKMTTKSTAGKAGKAVEGQSVTIKLGSNAKNYGVTVIPSTQATDFAGDASFVIKVPEGLNEKERAELKRLGINYQLSYVEKGVTYESLTQKVNITTPTVDFKVLNAANNIDNQAGYIFNAMGETKTIQAQLSNQSTQSQIANQPIKLSFNNTALASLLNVNGQIGSASIIANTSDTGIVSFDVVVPNNLTDEQKAKLNNQILTGTLTETLTGKQQQIKVKVQSMVAAITLKPRLTNTLNLNGGETQVEVTVADKAAVPKVIAGQKVFLALPAKIASQGVTLVSGGSQTTDNSGKAVFTIAVPNNLTNEQKAAIGRSFTIALSAADPSGNIATQTTSVSTVTPTGTTENISIGADKVVNTKGDTFKVFVRVANQKGSVANRQVRLNVDDPIKTGVTVTNNTATTNGDGVATFDLKLEKGANVNQALLKSGIRITATTTTAENVELKQNYIVAVDTTTIDNYKILVSSDKSTLTTGGDQTNATFRVTDSSGGILAGVPVQLSIENLEASGAALTTPSMVTTDADGKIDVGILLAANSINARLNHDVEVIAKIITPQYDAQGNAIMQVREQKSLNLSAVGTEITLVSSATQLKDKGTATITTTLTDGAGRTIANAGMELVDATGALIYPEAKMTTNANGAATFVVREDQLTFDNNGNLQVFAKASGESSLVTQRSLTSIDLVKVSQAGISFIDIKDVYDVNMAQAINIQIRTNSAAEAAALIGKRVEVQTTIGKFANGQVITTQPIVAANVQGNIITVPVQLTSQLAGTAVLQATVLGEMVNGAPKYQTTVDTRFRATTPAKMLFQAVKSVITPGSSTELVATVKDKNDVPVEGQTVVFSRTADSSAGRLSAATAVTDSKGEARVVYLANASSPIGGVVINANLLKDTNGIGTKTTNITVSKEAVYTTLAFSNKLSSDNIYYTVQGSISVMDGSGRAVANKEVSIKSYATEYAQGKVCLLDSTVTYQAAKTRDKDGVMVTPEPITKSESVPIFLKSNWIMTEDGNYNYTLDKEPDFTLTKPEDINGNGTLEAINPVAIIGGKLSDDGYTFVTDSEGRADFSIRYPMRYSNWVKVRFDATTLLNGSENLQSINYTLPSAESDLIINSTTLETPWIDNTSPFGDGGATCVSSMSVSINQNTNKTSVGIAPNLASSNYKVSINNRLGNSSTSANNSIYFVEFQEAFDLGSTITVSNNGASFSRVLKVN